MTQIRWQNPDHSNIESQSLDPVDFVIVGFTLVRGIVGAIATALAMADYVVRAHSNHRRDRQEFVGDVRNSIEKMP